MLDLLYQSVNLRVKMSPEPTELVRLVVQIKAIGIEYVMPLLGK